MRVLDHHHMLNFCPGLWPVVEEIFGRVLFPPHEFVVKVHHLSWNDHPIQTAQGSLFPVAEVLYDFLQSRRAVYHDGPRSQSRDLSLCDLQPMILFF